MIFVIARCEALINSNDVNDVLLLLKLAFISGFVKRTGRSSAYRRRHLKKGRKPNGIKRGTFLYYQH